MKKHDSSSHEETEIETQPQKQEEQEIEGVELVVNVSGTIDALIQKEVVKLAVQCRLFKSGENAEDKLAVFHRNEILTGAFLGNGAFSEVHQVWGFQLAHSTISRKPQEEQDRLKLCHTAYDQQGETSYVMKHLRRDLHHRGASKFINAAGDLVMEAKFLSYMDHRNIIKLHGWSGPSTNYHENSHDAFFLILDRLDLTLSHRLLQWQMDPAHSDAVYSRNLDDFQEKINIALQIASALEYLHNRDIIFRDLKPGKLLETSIEHVV
jgi:serine/threonine protein kinase